MGYHVVDPDELDSEPDRPCDLRRLSDEVGLENMAINQYTADPGEQLPLAYHYHDVQEEAFYVVSGTLSVETPDREYEVGAGKLFAVEPESPQRAYNAESADEPVVALVVGAPAVSGEVHPYEP